MDVDLIHIITEPTKFQIIRLLMRHNYCVRALSKKLGISEPAVSQQLNILKKAGIVSGRKIGYQMHYQVNAGRIREELGSLLACFGKAAASPDADADCSCEFASGCSRYNSDKGIR